MNRMHALAVTALTGGAITLLVVGTRWLLGW